MENKIIDFNDVLGPNGLIARRLSHYEIRSEQLAMSAAVAKAIRDKTHLAVEAGTGVGKSFAYLVPAILHVLEDQIAMDNPPPPEEKSEERRELEESFLNGDPLLFEPEGDDRKLRKVVISTHTISLQEQLIQKDIPFLQSILPYEFTAVLVKGRSNYLCLRRLDQAIRKMVNLFSDDQSNQLERLKNWSKKTLDGSRSELSPKPPGEIWSEVACEQGNCLGKQCRFFDQCFYNKARRQIANAQVIIANHALLFSDIALRSGSGRGILPQYDLLVVDEAHTMEQVAADHLGISLTQGQIDYLMNRLYNTRQSKGLLWEDGEHYTQGRDQVDECRSRSESLFNSLLFWLENRPGGNGRVYEADIVVNGLSEALVRLADILRLIIEKTKEPPLKAELNAARAKTTEIADTLKLWFSHQDPDMVYWLEESVSRGQRRVSMEAAPIDIGPLLRENLFGKIASVVMTSATLAAGNGKKRTITPAETEKAFTFFRSRIGLTTVPSLQVGSPFDYKKQMKLVLLKGIPEPEELNPDYQRIFRDMLQRYLEETDGGAFVLFTSYSFLRRMGSELLPWFAEKSLPFFSQADAVPRTKMLEEFKKDRRSILFGTDSFWQGVDVPGEGLRNVIISKLPFFVPNHPLTEARLEAIRKRGGNPFREYQLPSAVLKFKQGIGRLIRTKTDHGLVVVLDPRIHTKSYGKNFLEALPDASIRVDSVFH
ncbi:MAG: helicase C-terminal domain-containing protein [Planctomycetia bacterium]|nr:helicase C-terminal domain-containing protein [Planctomycetia bacterium]